MPTFLPQSTAVPRLLQGVVGLLSPAGAVTHEGAAAFDLRVEDPLQHLAFTKGAALLERSFYRTQAEEIRSYAQALLAAERAEPGFGWKFAAYVRDPERGKGNRIQGSVAPAILAAADPAGRFTEEYTYRCLRHRADDVALFVAHGKNLGLGEVPEAARRGMARALAGFDDYQLLKYASRQLPLLERRAGKPERRKTLRLVDAMGICKAHLDERTRSIYEYLHAPTRERGRLTPGGELVAARRRFFRGSDSPADFAAGRLSIEQALSFPGDHALAWRRIFDVPGLCGDLAFLRNLRSMAAAGIPIAELIKEASRRRFEGVWPHQVYAGYRAVMHGSTLSVPYRPTPVFSAPPVPQLEPVFDAALAQIARAVMPGESLGLADVSGSMFGAPLGGPRSTMHAGDVAVLFSALLARSLGYAAGFSDDITIVDPAAGESAFRLADRLKATGAMGSTQVAGAVRSLLARLLREPRRPRPRTLYFFSDMQFHPPTQQSFTPQWRKGEPADPLAGLARPLDPRDPPLLALLKLWRETLGPVDVVLWNLAAYDASPAPSGMDHVLMLSGFDANSFSHVRKWQASGSLGGRPGKAAAAARDPRVELDVIRTF